MKGKTPKDKKKFFLQARLDANLRPKELPLINAILDLTNTVNPNDPDGRYYNQRQAVVKIMEEWLGIDRKDNDRIENMLVEIQEMIIESHNIIFDKLLNLDLHEFRNPEGRSMHDEIGDNLNRLNKEAIQNVIADKIIHVDVDDEDEPEGW